MRVEVAMQSIQQHPSDLVLALFTGEPRFPMTLMRSARVKHGAWSVHFHVIGESHAAIMTHQDEIIRSETLSCHPVAADRCELYHPFPDMQDYQLSTDGYQIEVVFDHPTWELPYPKNDEMLYVAFPEVYGQTPVTRIQWEHTAEGLRWWTLHVYPFENSKITVYTRSYLNTVKGN